jgi:hypothetical protein
MNVLVATPHPTSPRRGEGPLRRLSGAPLSIGTIQPLPPPGGGWVGGGHA